MLYSIDPCPYQPIECEVSDGQVCALRGTKQGDTIAMVLKLLVVKVNILEEKVIFFIKLK
jgi:hypothetical protein